MPPVIDKEAILYLKYAHGSFNALMFLLFICQGSLGLKMRRRRLRGGPIPVGALRRHRRAGPILAPFGVMGFLAGLGLVYLDKGHFLEYPLHFLVGSAIALSIVSTFFVSRKIRGSQTPWRRPHFALGVLILFLYAVQVLLGAGMLF
jgi:hypothetical protein